MGTGRHPSSPTSAANYDPRRSLPLSRNDPVRGRSGRLRTPTRSLLCCSRFMRARKRRASLPDLLGESKPLNSGGSSRTASRPNMKLWCRAKCRASTSLGLLIVNSLSLQPDYGIMVVSTWVRVRSHLGEKRCRRRHLVGSDVDSGCYGSSARDTAGTVGAIASCLRGNWACKRSAGIRWRTSDGCCVSHWSNRYTAIKPLCRPAPKIGRRDACGRIVLFSSPRGSESGLCRFKLARTHQAG